SAAWRFTRRCTSLDCFTLPRRVAILGSTGSIGTQALDVITRHADRFSVCGLAAGKQVDKLREQCEKFGVNVAASAQDGPAGLLRVAIESQPDVLLAATDGFVSFDAVFAAVERGTDIAIANKELIVAAGDLLISAAAKSGSQIVPVDSEHSAIFQCLIGENRDRVHAIVLTASGGPFWRKTKEEIGNASLDAALAHPTWQMGVKNTVDSASMMNKGLEVIEASRLFGFPGERIGIVVHPQSIAHGIVIFSDGNVKIQAAAPDMRLPIGYALAYPERLTTDQYSVSNGVPKSLTGASPTAARPPRAKPVGPPDFLFDPLQAIGAHPEASALRFDFERPDPDRFPCVALAYEALAADGTMPAVLSAANEIAVRAFVEGEIAFGQIPDIIGEALSSASAREVTLATLRQADAQARDDARAAVNAARRVKV
ncbi:MAG TPA: 1-deoxy-D-xylulose-5-phosphate reductoisomerase, partial [Candidatus Rubrimentiphilum sp.]|nr:1-deoxy-D-xylulose-5-phosphate reductoisomerase [Candidatus Rubrimentiphilum sp.]